MSTDKPVDPLVLIENYFVALEASAGGAASREEFSPEFVQNLVTVCGAAGGQLWRTTGTSPLIEAEASAEESHRVWSTESRHETRRAVDRARTGRDRLVLFPGKADAEAGLVNTSPFTWLIAAIKTPTETPAVLVVMTEPAADPVWLNRLTELIGSACELAAGFFTRQQLRDLDSERRFQEGIVQAAVKFHTAQSLEDVVLEIVTASRELVGCDRVLLLSGTSRRMMLRASSGVESVSLRSDLARLLARLVREAVRGEGVWGWDAGRTNDDSSPASQHRVSWVDASHCRGLRIVPLVVRGSGDSASTDSIDHRQDKVFVGALVFEWFQAVGDRWTDSRGEALAAHAAGALQNCQDWQRAPLARRLRNWRRSTSTRSMSRALVLLLVVAVVVAALVFIPAELRVEAKGELLPVKRTSVFAPRDGTVRELFVDTSADVSKGTPLITLENEQLDLDTQRVDGEMQTALKQRHAIETSRLENRPTENDAVARSSRLTAELEEVEERIRSLEQQRTLLAEQHSALRLVADAPGRVLTWNARATLDHRPVRRGQLLLAIADLEGPWEIRLAIPDHRSGHVQRALASGQGDLKVDFTLASEPGVSRRAVLERVGTSAEVRLQGERPTIEGVVPVAKELIAELRPGVSAEAKIHCGTYPLGYVWFHELWELAYRVAWF